MLANLTMRALDRRLSLLAQMEGWTYTRYADDLAFSRSGKAFRIAAMGLARRVAYELKLAGLIHRREKTSVVPPGARKVLLGVLVDRERPRLTRAFRNNIETHLFALTSDKVGPAAPGRNAAPTTPLASQVLLAPRLRQSAFSRSPDRQLIIRHPMYLPAFRRFQELQENTEARSGKFQVSRYWPTLWQASIDAAQ
jgi:hypothetical protein